MRTTFSSTPNIRKLIFWSAELELIHFWRSGHDDKRTRGGNDGKVLAPSFGVISYNTPFNLPSHLQCNSSFYHVYINIHTLMLFFPFIFIFLFIFCTLIIFSCSGMFHVPGFIDARRVLVKKTARTTFSFTPNLRIKPGIRNIPEHPRTRKKKDTKNK